MKKILGLLGLVLVAGVAVVVKYVLPSRNMTPDGSGMVKSPKIGDGTSMTDSGKTPSQSNDGLPEGMKEFSVTKMYQSPAGGDEIRFTIDVDTSGVIMAAKTGILATNDISKQRQETFAAGLPTVIVGKKLLDLMAIDKVGGSSLTTTAFNEALGDLKAQQMQQAR